MHLLTSLPVAALFFVLTASVSATPYSTPQRLHYDPESQTPSNSPSNLFRRQANYQCNPGTFSCSSIGRPQLCCNNGETCQKIDDIGYGDVGCCPAGSTCTGNLSGCGDDKISCLRSVGGGCCNKGSMCTRRGCIVDPALGAKIESEGSASIAPTGAGLGAVIGVTVGTETPSPTIPARRPISTETSLCDDGWRACAAAAGGGCCPQDYNCGVRNCPAKRMLVTQMVDGVAATLTVQMSPVPKRSQNVFIPITPAEAVGMRASDVRWLLTVPVVLGMAIGGVLVL